VKNEIVFRFFIVFSAIFFVSKLNIKFFNVDTLCGVENGARSFRQLTQNWLYEGNELCRLECSS